MARHARGVLHSREEFMLAGKIRSIVLLWPQAYEVRVAGLTIVGAGQIIVASVAGGHGGKALLSRKRHCVESLMTGLAGHALPGHVKFVIERYFAFGILECDIGCLISARVAIGAIALELLFVTGLTVGFLAQKVVG
jgi:hypothetical protein